MRRVSVYRPKIHTNEIHLELMVLIFRNKKKKKVKAKIRSDVKFFSQYNKSLIKTGTIFHI